LLAGTSHVLAVDENGKVYAWGLGTNGQLGNGGVVTSNIPVVASSITNATKVAAGGTHSAAIDADGNVWGFGDASAGRIGNGTTATTASNISTPTKVMTATTTKKAVQIVASSANTYILTDEIGTSYVYGTGATSSGQVGSGSTSSTAIGTFTKVNNESNSTSGLTGVKEIYAGGSSAAALKTDGTVVAWGANGTGRLGVGDSSNKSYPNVVKTEANTVLTNVQHVSIGTTYSIFADNNGNIYGAGTNASYQLGNGTTDTTIYATLSNKLENIISLNSPQNSTFNVAITNNGDIYGWGLNDNYQLGTKDIITRKVPTKVFDKYLKLESTTIRIEETKSANIQVLTTLIDFNVYQDEYTTGRITYTSLTEDIVSVEPSRKNNRIKTRRRIYKSRRHR